MIKLKIDYHAIITFFLFLFLTKLPCYDYIGLGRISDILQICTICITLAFYILKRLMIQNKLSWIVVLIAAMQLWQIFTTVVNKGSVYTSIHNFVSILSIALAFEIMISRPASLIKGLMILGETLCYVNLATILLFPDGLFKGELYWQNWLFGFKNLFLPYLIVFCMVAYMYRCQGGNKYREWCLYIASLLSVILVDSSTSTWGLVLLILLILIRRLLKVKYGAYFMTYVNAALVVAIPVLRLQEFFSFIIVFIFGRSLTFTGRTALWDTVFQLVGQSPIFGYGIQQSERTQSLLGFNWAYHTHNLIFEFIFRGGIPLLVMYLLLIVLICRHLHRYKKSEVAQGAIIMLFAFQVMGLMEVYSSSFLYIIYFLAYYVKDFVSAEVANNKESNRRRIKLKWNKLGYRG